MRGVALVCCIAGCSFGADLGVLQHPELEPKGASAGGHVGIGGGGMSASDYLLAIDLDTRVDVASGGSRWAAGASVLGGRSLGPLFATARVGVWRAITSSTRENAAVPSFELGGFVPLDERSEAKHPQHGASVGGLTFGAREDLDDARYLTLFVGYAFFMMPGY